MIAAGEVVALGERGFFLRDSLLGQENARSALEALRSLHAQGSLRRAGITRAGALRDDIRGDEIAWLDDAPHPALLPVAAFFEALRDALNREAYLGLRRTEIQLARYAPGARYDRHLDAFPGGPNRVATCVWWLNDGWQPGDGGELQVYPPGGAPLAVEPRLDRAIVFLAAKVEHEVLVARRERYAITAWYRGA